jgi:hypothetical protein
MYLPGTLETYEYEGDSLFHRQNSAAISSPTDSLPYISVGNCQRALVDESGTTTNLMGTLCRSEMVAVQVLPYAPTPQR